MPPHPTLADVIRRYKAEKALESWYGDWGSAVLYRPLSFGITPLLLHLSVSATAVTLFSLAISLSLPILAVSGTADAALAVALLGILVKILDCVDGNIARTTGTASRTGHYLDFITDVVFRMTIYTSLGIVIDGLGASPIWLSGNAFGLGAVAALLAVGARLCRVYGELMTGNKVGARPNTPGSGSAMSKYIFPFISGLDSLTSVAMLVALYSGWLGWLLLWLLAYSTADFLHTQYEILAKLR